MAFNAATEWEVRTTGSDSNGGGFNTAATGTDFSQQDSPQFTYTDLVIDATTNTKVTSAAHPFDSTSPGNIINVTSGTGFTVQRVQVVSVAGAVATCDKSLGTLSSTGGNGKLGGGLLGIATAINLVVSLNTVWIKAGTYTITSTLLLNNTSGNMPGGSGAVINGYQTTHGDNGTKPLITTATNSTKLFTFQQAANNVTLFFHNLSMSNTASIREDGMYSNFADTNLLLSDCILDGFANGISPAFYFIFLDGVEIKNCTGQGVTNRCRIHVTDSYIHNNTNNGIDGFGSFTQFVVCRSIVTSNGGKGIFVESTPQDIKPLVINSTVANNTGNGIEVSGAAGQQAICLENTIIYGNATGLAGTGYAAARNNAWGANSTKVGASIKFAWLLGDVTLSASPFTNSGSGDYSLNSTAGGGTACKGAGFPGAFPGGTSTGSLDIGAVATSTSSISFPAASNVYAGVNRGDGVTGTLHASNISTAAGHGVNLSAGILQSGSVVDDVTGSLSPGASIAFNPLGGTVA